MSSPNFIIFLTDDQGYGDLSCMGTTDFRTPNLDELAESGARFTSWYSNSPVCSPSRASLLTGRYPVKAGVRSIISGERTSSGLPPAATTLASVLKDNGYHTGMFGKWHLGAAEDSRPHAHGFDEWFGFLSGCIDYYSHIFYWGMGRDMDQIHDLWENGEEIYRNGEYFTELITERAVDFIRKQADSDQPFFLYVPYNAPHYPMHAPQEYLDRFSELPWDRQIMAAMLSAVDDSIGSIRSELKRQGILEDTCIFFQSDNGPSRETRNWLDGTRDPYYGGSAGKLKGHKFSLFEGGIRVPGIISWPGEIHGNQVIDRPAAAMDIFPTFLNMAGIELEGHEVDGNNILPMLKGDNTFRPHDKIFWEMGEQTAVRTKDWKLVLNGQLVEGNEPENELFLANLAEDMGEKNNLKNDFPQKSKELKEAAQSWRRKIDNKWENKWQDKVQEEVNPD